MSRFDVIDLSEAKIHPTTMTRLHWIMMHPVVRSALDEGGWIAGGFIRQILLGNDIKEYFQPSTDARAGDIDIFFDDAEKARSFVNSVSSTWNPSWGGFAKDVSVSTPGSGSVTIQLVDSPDLCLPFEESLSRFDFTNCMVALRGGKLYIPHGWKELEDNKQLQVISCSSPFLGTRIIKYMKSRGLSQISPESMPILSDWIYKVAAGDFPNYTPRHIEGLESAIRRLYNMNKLDPAFLTLFMGRWVSYDKISKNYGLYDTIAIDWAQNEISKLREGSFAP